MNKNKIVYSLGDIPEVARVIKERLNTSRIVTFTGQLGAGKTTLVKELLKQYGVNDMVTSPTFTYVNIYSNSEGQHFYHFDLYRIETLSQFLEAGFDEYLSQANSRVFIEWPESIESLFDENVCRIVIEYADEGRVLTLTC